MKFSWKKKLFRDWTFLNRGSILKAYLRWGFTDLLSFPLGTIVSRSDLPALRNPLLIVIFLWGFSLLRWGSCNRLKYDTHPRGQPADNWAHSVVFLWVYSWGRKQTKKVMPVGKQIWIGPNQSILLTNVNSVKGTPGYALEKETWSSANPLKWLGLIIIAAHYDSIKCWASTLRRVHSNVESQLWNGHLRRCMD